eukprot:CAMPEP_0184657856 /NCGR_PEP_ID=MMETSP0308-20130426/22178_1 /TAXON_ID=38269 /ORGANISM="Gloeochaete witrockiana, Strain SAG 46.84" /LENGTH=426 /DNA_ID=CAMNT_0027096215 /DNA_START=361 /DNA_END=1641 /DNA_ORIENTATION=+
MAASYKDISSTYIGVAVGVVSAAYYLANFFASFVIGHLSDHWGRRPLLLFGLFASFTATATFGFCDTFAKALANRVFLGFCDSNGPIAKAFLTDISPRSLRPMVFAWYGAVFALTRSLSSGASGLATALPVPIGFQHFPYALPCLLVATPLGFVFTLAVLYLEDVRVPRKRDIGPQPSLWQGLKSVFGDATLRQLVLMFCIHSFGNGGVLVALVLFSSASRTEHGLGFGALENGVLYMFFGLVGFCFQVTSFKAAVRRLGLRATYRVGTMLSCLGAFLLYTSSVVAPHTEQISSYKQLIVPWVLLLLFTAHIAIGFMIGIPIIGTMLSFAAEDEKQGLTQGTAQSCASLARSMGPFISGVLFTGARGLHNPSLALLIMIGTTYFLAFLASIGLSSRVESLHMLSQPPIDEKKPLLLLSDSSTSSKP